MPIPRLPIKLPYARAPFPSKGVVRPVFSRKDAFTDVINTPPEATQPDPEVPEGSVRAEDGSIIKLEGKPTNTTSFNNTQDRSN
jgi:hypothetical protein